jgi:hypothetical protein
MQGNWDGYTPEAIAIPGHEVSNITIEDSVVSTSISNIVRAAWPDKTFDSHHFTMHNFDVLHMGVGRMRRSVRPVGDMGRSEWTWNTLRLPL